MRRLKRESIVAVGHLARFFGSAWSFLVQPAFQKRFPNSKRHSSNTTQVHRSAGPWMNAGRLVNLVAGITTAVVLVLGLTLTTGIRPSAAAMGGGQPMHFDIAPQQLPSALLKFSEQSGVQVTSSGQLVEGKRSPGVVGTFDPRKALALLLENTSLHFDVVDANTVVIEASDDSKSPRKDFQRVSLARATAANPAQIQSVGNSNNVTNSSPTSKEDEDKTKVEEVVITGSSIKRINAETALPVQILKREDIARTGATTVEELFRQVSSATSSGNTVAAQESGNNTGAISTISLRGLGSGRTLVLINGRRTAAYGGAATGTAGNSVDISSIPVALIDRVEILKDGASAIYGSDAIAGVVNFILRSDYQGAEIAATAGSPAHGGGGTEENFSAYAGMGDLKQDHYNAALGITAEHVNAIMASERPFATRYSPGYGNDVTSAFSFPANVALPNGSTRNPLAPNCGPYSLNDVYFPNRCRFDNSPFDSLEPEQKKFNISFNGRIAVAGANQLYSEASYSKVKTTTTVQPVPLSYQNILQASNPYNAFLTNLLATRYAGYQNKAIGPGSAAFLLPPSSPYYPTAFAIANGVNGQPLNLIYRDFANGLRSTQDAADTIRVVGGFKGKAGGWDYDTSLLYSEVKVSEDLQSGFALYSKIMPLLDSGTINPFGPTSDPAALQAAKSTEFTGQDFATRTSITSLSGTASRELYALPAGPLSAAAGAEFRRETFKFNPAAAIQTGDITGLGGNQLPESASRNVRSAFLEFNAPLARGLEADAAVRYDNYQGIGSTANPKASLRWQPDSWLLMRASAGTGFRAPSLTDLYAAQATGVTSNGTRDPIRCPPEAFDPNLAACNFQFTTITGGNPHLKPEKSQTFTLGVVLEPIRNLSLDLDSFWIYLKNQIVVGGLNYATILQNAQTATQFASFITRNAAGQIVSINQTNANLFKSAVSGLDADLKYDFRVGNAGHATLLWNGTYFYRYVSQNPDGTWTGQLDKGLTNVGGTLGGVVARWRYNVTAAYSTSSWNISMTQNFQKGYHDVPSSITNVPRDVSAYQTIDAQASYLGLKSFKFTLGAKNIFNRTPPYANYAASANNFIGGYDVSYGDPRGTFLYASAEYHLH
jgi:iron complex outermembrane recepter protein